MAEDNSSQTPEPEVVKAVQKEIVALGENTKKNYEDLNKSLTEMRHLVDESKGEVSAELKEQIVKFSEEITTRQGDLDKKAADALEVANNRMDQIEVALKRPGQEDTKSYDKDMMQLNDEAKQFAIASHCVKDVSAKGLTMERLEALNVDVDAFKNYLPAMESFIRKDERFLAPENLRALSVGIDPDGGYTVTPAMSNTIVTKLRESDPVRQLSSVETITTGAIEWMVDWGDTGYGWEGETVAGDETNTPQWKKKRIPVHVMYAKPRASQTLLEDSGINIENWLANKVADRFMRAEGEAFVAGQGVNSPRGFLTYDNGVNWGQIEQVNMGAAAALTGDGFHDVKMSLIEHYLNRGTWLMNRLTVNETLQLKDGTGNYIWRAGLEPNMPSNILGLPVRMSTTMPTIAAGTLSVAIADWREAYMVVDRLGITIIRDNLTVKPMIEFYTRKRVGGDVINYQAIKLGKIAV